MASSGEGGPPLSPPSLPPLRNLPDPFRDAIMTEEAKLEVACPSPKCARSVDGPEGSIAHMGNPIGSDSADPRAKRAQHLAPASPLRRPIRV